MPIYGTEKWEGIYQAMKKTTLDRPLENTVCKIHDGERRVKIWTDFKFVLFNIL